MSDNGSDQALDSAIPWVAEHTQRYIDTGGADGHIWHGSDGSFERGVPCLVLFTLGRTSGQIRRNALIYIVDGDDYIIVGSRGGAPTHAQWYLNLMAQPQVQIQVLDERFAVEATVVSADEKERLWPRLVEAWPDYENYRANTDREIPVIRLRRV